MMDKVRGQMRLAEKIRAVKTDRVAALVIASGLVSDTDGLNGIYNEVRAKLNATATNLGVAGKDTQYGWGLVNAVAATQ